MKRRDFIKLAAGAVIVPTILLSSVLGKGLQSPNNRINIGVIGVGAMGWGNLNSIMGQEGTQVVAVCDVCEGRGGNVRDPSKPHNRGLQPAKAHIEAHYAKNKPSGKYTGCDAYSDYRELCAREDIDAVVISTPDHWHALQIIEAVRNGKDVYCEKPVTHLFREGQVIYKEVEKHGAIFQTGSWQRSRTRFRMAAEVAANRLFGKIKHVEIGLPTGATGPEMPSGVLTPYEGFDYDFWCGPSRKPQYHPQRTHWDWRWCLDYGGGQMMDWIGHHNDIAHWGLGMDKSGPVKVEATGFTYPKKGIWDAAINYEVKCEYAEGYTTSISNKNPMGCKWIGEDGWVHVSRGSISSDKSTKRYLREKADRGSIKLYESRNHHQNFVDCIRSRKECITPAETAHRSITPGHLAMVSQAMGRPLKWDPAKEEVIGDSEADKQLNAVPYRDGWKLKKNRKLLKRRGRGV